MVASGTGTQILTVPSLEPQGLDKSFGFQSLRRIECEIVGNKCSFETLVGRF
jgi:hypothetical protein